MSAPPSGLLERVQQLLSGDEPPPEHVLRSVVEILSYDSTGSGVGPSSATSNAANYGTSLNFQQTPDLKREAYLKRHASREIKAPVDERARKIGQYQALLEGEGGKYVHADNKPNGGTQIGNWSSQTPSMMSDWDNPGLFAAATTTLGKGAPPIKKYVSSNRAFRVA
mmetsp:Transcript_8254/g.21668  ORF Transcript_8254/g.21668 Transcript_8254/m.21668 type:complete len:167 (+) Transcript_8254:3-503(+)